MNFKKILAELPHLTFEEREILIRTASEFDDSTLSAADEELVEARLAAHHDDPNSSVPLHELKGRLRSG